MDQWSPKKLLLASLGVAILSSALTGAIVVWLLSGQKSSESVFLPPTSPSISTAPVGPLNTPPADPVLAGNWHYDRQQWTQAIESYEKAIKAGFDNPDVRTDLGNCHRFSKRPEAALEQYEIAQKNDPQHEHSLFNQISLYAEDLKNPAKASVVAQEFINRFSNSPNVSPAKKYLIPE